LRSFIKIYKSFIKIYKSFIKIYKSFIKILNNLILWDLFLENNQNIGYHEAINFNLPFFCRIIEFNKSFIKYNKSFIEFNNYDLIIAK